MSCEETGPPVLPAEGEEGSNRSSGRQPSSSRGPMCLRNKSTSRACSRAQEEMQNVSPPEGSPPPQGASCAQPMRSSPSAATSSSSPLFVESRSGDGSTSRTGPSASSSSMGFSVDASSDAGPADFERLGQEELFVMYSTLDMDDDTVVTGADLFAFIALNPQCIDTVIGHHVGLVSGAEQYPYWARVDSSKLGIVPMGARGLAYECGPASWRPGLTGAPTTSESSTNSGALWWLRHRVAMHFRDKKFVDFVLNVAFSVLTKDKAAGAAGTGIPAPSLGANASSSSHRRELNLTSSVFMSTTATSASSSARKQQRSSNKKKKATTSDLAKDDDEENQASSSMIPQFLSFRSFCLLYYEVIDMLSAKEHAFMLVMLDVPMLLSVHTFFRFLATFCRLTGRMPPPSAKLSKTNSDASAAQKRLFPHFNSTVTNCEILDPAVLANRIPRCPSTSCASCISWLVGAWEQQRGMLHVPILQRIGERFLFRKAAAQDRQLKHFLRCFRHAWGPQQVGGGGPSRAPASAMVPSSAQPVAAASVVGAGKATSSSAVSMQKLAASSNLQALKVRGRLASMRVLVEQVAPSLSEEDDDSVAGGDGVGSSLQPPTTKLASSIGLTPPTRSLTPAVAFGGIDLEASPEFNEDDGRKKKVSPYDSTSHVVHALAEPDALSMISSLSCDERRKFQRIRFWCLLRACIYSLVTATIVGLTNLVCQAFFFSTTPSLFDSSISSSQALLNWISGGVYVPVQLILATNESIFQNGTAATGVSSPGMIGSATTANSLSMRDVLKYQLVVSGVALILSVVEIVVLYLDNLQVCFSLAKTGGVPLHRYSTGSRDGDGKDQDGRPGGGGRGAAWDDRVLSVKDGLSTKRIRYFIAAISRCALQIAFDAKTVLSIDVSDSQSGIISQFAARVAERLRRIAPTLVVRVLVSRVLTKFVAPFVATPLMVLWNFVLARASVDAATSVVLGAISAERLARQLLDTYFAVPNAIIEHNSRAQVQQHTAAGSRDGGGVKISGIHQAHFHVYRELVSLIAFYMHVIGSKTVHPSLHIFLAYIASHVQLPEECLLCYGDSSSCGGRGKHNQLNDRSSRRASNIASTLVEIREDDDDDDQLSVGDSSLSSVPSASTGAGTAGHLSLALVGGNAPNSLLSIWMTTMCREMNAFRQELFHSHGTEWTEEYVLNASSPSDSAARSELCSKVAPSLTCPREWRECKVVYAMETAFPGWACPATIFGVGCALGGQQQQQQQQQQRDVRGKGSYPYSPRDVELFVCTGLLCCILSNTRGVDFKTCVKHATFIRQLAVSYATHKTGSCADSALVGRELVAKVQALSERYLAGYAVDLGHVQAALHSVVCDQEVTSKRK